jgi:hypothetical protein
VIPLAVHRCPAANVCECMSETGEWDNDRQ